MPDEDPPVPEPLPPPEPFDELPFAPLDPPGLVGSVLDPPVPPPFAGSFDEESQAAKTDIPPIDARRRRDRSAAMMTRKPVHPACPTSAP